MSSSPSTTAGVSSSSSCVWPMSTVQLAGWSSLLWGFRPSGWHRLRLCPWIRHAAALGCHNPRCSLWIALLRLIWRYLLFGELGSLDSGWSREVTWHQCHCLDFSWSSINCSSLVAVTFVPVIFVSACCQRPAPSSASLNLKWPKSGTQCSNPNSSPGSTAPNQAAPSSAWASSWIQNSACQRSWSSQWDPAWLCSFQMAAPDPDIAVPNSSAPPSLPACYSAGWTLAGWSCASSCPRWVLVPSFCWLCCHWSQHCRHQLLAELASSPIWCPCSDLFRTASETAWIDWNAATPAAAYVC